MFEEAQLYAPVTRSADGDVEVHLAADHPGATDPVYRSRRNAIAALALAWRPGDPIPHAEYTDEEHEVWRVACAHLHELHETLACREYLEGKAALRLPEDHVPQLDEVSDLLQPLTGFRYVPAAGLVPLLVFYGSLADRVFHSTQYIRHHSVPLYTPEPDVVHEVVGHANCLASPRFAALYQVAGEAARRVESAEALEFVSKVFWFSLEFGVLREPDGVKTYGAGLLSSYGEIQEFRAAHLRPLEVARMGVQTYDITHYQPVLFCADSFAHVEDVVGGFFAGVDDDAVARLQRAAVPSA
ncbi:MAG TPA: phenylalanine 4-monooxygenase [Actinomycetes bacterium]|nr:phenylalanine 4-monooxygenase [Actinomycetes bacterium]